MLAFWKSTFIGILSHLRCTHNPFSPGRDVCRIIANICQSIRRKSSPVAATRQEVRLVYNGIALAASLRIGGVFTLIGSLSDLSMRLLPATTTGTLLSTFLAF